MSTSMVWAGVKHLKAVNFIRKFILTAFKKIQACDNPLKCEGDQLYYRLGLEHLFWTLYGH